MFYCQAILYLFCNLKVISWLPLFFCVFIIFNSSLINLSWASMDTIHMNDEIELLLIENFIAMQTIHCI